MRMMIKDILTKNNFEVVGEAADGVQAIEKYFDLKPDLVTMDITMPEMDGIAALKAIKEKDPLRRSSCVQQWGNKQWSSMQFKQVQKILSLNLSKQIV